MHKDPGTHYAEGLGHSPPGGSLSYPAPGPESPAPGPDTSPHALQMGRENASLPQLPASSRLPRQPQWRWRWRKGWWDLGESNGGMGEQMLPNLRAFSGLRTGCPSHWASCTTPPLGGILLPPAPHLRDPSSTLLTKMGRRAGSNTALLTGVTLYLEEPRGLHLSGVYDIWPF